MRKLLWEWRCYEGSQTPPSRSWGPHTRLQQTSFAVRQHGNSRAPAGLVQPAGYQLFQSCEMWSPVPQQSIVATRVVAAMLLVSDQIRFTSSSLWQLQPDFLCCMRERVHHLLPDQQQLSKIPRCTWGCQDLSWWSCRSTGMICYSPRPYTL